MFLRNCWYTAAWDYELDDRTLLSRKFLDEQIVIWRQRNGTPVAIRDLCPHRFVPMSIGKRVGDALECGYHGLTFDGAGRCVAAPCQNTIPKAARVKSYPMAEKHGFLWIWMGDPEKADRGTIPDFHYHKDPAWDGTGGMIRVAANYELISDNLIDLSHLNFIHGSTLGNEACNAAEVKTVVEGNTVEVKRYVPDAPPVPAWEAAFRAHKGHEGKVDHWLNMKWVPPGFLYLDVGVKPVGRPMEEGLRVIGTNLLTPETDRITNYFWGVCRPYGLDDPWLNKFWHDVTNFAFNQDRDVIEAQQRCMDAEGIATDAGVWSMALGLKGDAGQIQCRRVLRRLLDAEREERAVAAE